MRKILVSVVVIALVGAGIWYAFGSEKKAQAFGKGVEATLVQISEIQQHPQQFLGQTVTVEGEMTKECPGSGCWWYIKDQSGEIRADSSYNGFALPLHQEGKVIRTTGKVTRTESGELQIDASGAVLK